jgi:hypothetical protein
VKRIVKYDMPGARFTVELPANAQVVSVLTLPNQRPAFWLIADDEAPTVERQFAVIKTGEVAPRDGRHLGTFLVHDPFEGTFEGHLFERGLIE